MAHRIRVLTRLLATGVAAILVSTCDLLTEPGQDQTITITFTSDTTLVVGTTIAPGLDVTIAGSTAPEPRLRLESSDPGVVAISTDGDSLRVVGRGRTTIRATLIGATLTENPPFVDVPVRAVADTVILDSLTVAFFSLTDTASIPGRAVDANGEEILNTTLTWETGNDTIVTVDATGRVTARGNGTATVRAMVDDDTATVSVEVDQRLARFRLEPAVLSLAALGDTATITATPEDTLGSDIPATRAPAPAWASDNTAVASVNATGRITALTNGDALVTATAGDVVDTVQLEVRQIADTIFISPDTVTLPAIDATIQLVAFAFDKLGTSVVNANPFWVSRDLAAAQVDAQTGLVRALGVGSAFIVVQLDAAKDSIEVVVTNRSATLDVSPDSVLFTSVGDTIQFAGTARNPLQAILPGVPILWEALDTTIVGMLPTGEAAARSVGSTRIVGRVDPAVSDSVIADTSIVVVQDRPVTVAITPLVDTLASIGDVVSPPVDIRNARGASLARSAVDWATSDAGVASVSGDGVVTAVSRGTAVIRATNPFNPSRFDEVTIEVTNAPVVLALNRTLDTLTAPTRTLQYSAVAQNAAGAVNVGENVTWRSSNATVADVTTGGLATALDVGTALIIGETTGAAGVRADTATLVVTNVAVNLTVSPPSAVVPSVGATFQLGAAARNDVGGDVPGVTFIWETSDPLVATVDGTGLVTGVSIGTATVTARLGLLSASAAVEVTNSPETLEIIPTQATLASVDDQVTPPVDFQNALSVALPRTAANWSTADGAIAQVSPSGVITATGRGTTTIRAENPINPARSDEITIIVTNAPDSIAVNRTLDTLPSLNRTLAYSATVWNARRGVIVGEAVVWASSATAVATITQTGVATAVGIGTTTISATAGTVSDAATLVVSNSSNEVTISPTSLALTSIGETATLTATARNELGNVIPTPTVVWTPADPGVATVSPAGLVTAVAEGATTVSATVDGITATVSVTVNDVPTLIAFAVPASVTLASVGDQNTPVITIQNALTTVLGRGAVTWTTTDPNVAIVSGTGVITATGAGAATIRAESPFDATVGDNFTVTVTNAPASMILLNQDPDTLTAIGRTLQYLAEVRNLAGAVIADSVTWGSSVPGVATISAGGIAQAQGVGTTVITGTASDGILTATATLVVTNDAISIVVTPARDTILDLGTTLQLSAVALNDLLDTVPGTVIVWSDSGAGTVNATGLVTATAIAADTGLAKIIATTNAAPNTVADTAIIFVVDAPRTVTITSGPLVLASVGDVVIPAATIQNAATTTLSRGTVTWSTSAPNVASVSDTGRVVAQGRGFATISATSPFDPLLTSSIVVQVTDAPVSVALDRTDDTLTAIGRTLPYNAVVVNAAGNPIPTETVTWSSSSDPIATISAAGVATGVDTGAVTITATVTSTPAITATAALRVENRAATVTLEPASVTITALTDTAHVTARTRNDLGVAIDSSDVRWTTSNAAVVTVPTAVTKDSIRITAAGVGTATVTAKVRVGAGPDSVAGQLAVTVTDDPTTIDITPDTPPDSIILASLGETVSPTVTITNSVGTALARDAVLWSSTNSAVATVSTSGLVTAVDTGITFIRAVSPANGAIRDSVRTRVNNTPAAVTINAVAPADTLTAIGQSITYTATVENALGDVIPGAAVSWLSSDGTRVSAVAGTITALGFTIPLTDVTVTASSGTQTSPAITIVVRNPDTLYVDKDLSVTPRHGTIKRPYASIQDAADAADPGDVIVVSPATTAYAEPISLAASVTLQGADSTTAVCVGSRCTTPTALATIAHTFGAAAITAATNTTVKLRHLAVQHSVDGPAVDADGAAIEAEYFYVNPTVPATPTGRGINVRNVSIDSVIVHKSVIQEVVGYGVRLENVSNARIDSVRFAEIDSTLGVTGRAGVELIGTNGVIVARDTFTTTGTTMDGVRLRRATAVTLTGNLFTNGRYNVHGDSSNTTSTGMLSTGALTAFFLTAGDTLSSTTDSVASSTGPCIEITGDSSMVAFTGARIGGCATTTGNDAVRVTGGPATELSVTASRFTNMDRRVINFATGRALRLRGDSIHGTGVPGAAAPADSAVIFTGPTVDTVTIDSTVVTDFPRRIGLNLSATDSIEVDSARVSRNRIGVRLGATVPPVGFAFVRRSDIYDNGELGGTNFPDRDAALLGNWWGDGAAGPRRDLTVFTTPTDTAATGDTVAFTAFTGAYAGNFQTTRTYAGSGADTLRLVRGNNQATNAAATNPDTLDFNLTVRVADAQGRPVAGVSVTFDLDGSGGATCDTDDGVTDPLDDDIDPASLNNQCAFTTTTDASGLAQANIHFGDITGTRTVTVTAAGVANTVLFTATRN